MGKQLRPFFKLNNIFALDHAFIEFNVIFALIPFLPSKQLEGLHLTKLSMTQRCKHVLILSVSLMKHIGMVNEENSCILDYRALSG